MGFFASLSPNIQIAFICAGTVIIVLALFLIFMIAKTKNIKSKFFTVSGDGEKIKSPHIECKHKTDIALLLLQQQEMLDRVYKILNKEIISMCMKEVEEEAHNVYYSVIDIFRKTVIKKQVTENTIELNKGFINYMELIKDYTIDEFRVWVRENHFSEKTESEFDMYAKNKSEYLEKTLKDFASEKKPFFDNEEYQDEIESIYPTIKFATIMVLKKCRSISVMKNDEVNKLRSDFDEKVKSLLGEFHV